MAERWRRLLAERVAEAVGQLGSIVGVHGIVVGGSVGRGQPWPLSDIDLLPIREPRGAAEIARRQAMLVDWWAASARAQTLDVGWLAFTPAEVEQATSEGIAAAAARMADARWLHGTDKAFGGYGAHDPDGLAEAFARWSTSVRFEPAVRQARQRYWQERAHTGHAAAVEQWRGGDRRAAPLAVRESALALRLVLVETWAERLGSMGREWTRFEQLAARHAAKVLAERIAWVAAADVARCAAYVPALPVWLQERIDRALQARHLVGEDVSPDHNARDQIAAFRVHVVRHQPHLAGAWLALPDPELDAKLRELGVLVERLT
jgi:predicted nucleotidyltransferase